MQKILCPECGMENTIGEDATQPAECTLCYASLSIGITTQQSTDKPDSELTGMTLLYQLAERSLHIGASGQTVLGRNHTGAALFSEIRYDGQPVISGRQCAVTFKDGKFYIQDERSHNGTYYGPNKLSCAEPRQLEDGGIIYLGREPFLIRYEYRDPAEIKQEINYYRCSACGGHFDVWSEICPNPLCNVYNKMKPISS